MLELPGFPDPKTGKDQINDPDDNFKRKNSKKTGGFQSMNLSFNVLKGVLKRGYKIPTPIQRKVILVFFVTIIYQLFLDHTNHNAR